MNVMKFKLDTGSDAHKDCDTLSSRQICTALCMFMKSGILVLAGKDRLCQVQKLSDIIPLLSQFKIDESPPSSGANANENTVDHFSKKLDLFLEQKVDGYNLDLPSDPMFKAWFEKFGVKNGLLELEEFIDIFVSACESPIEQMLLLALKTYGDEVASIHRYSYDSPSCIRDASVEPPTAWNNLVIQSQASTGKYRVDFKLTYRETGKDFCKENQSDFIARQVLVECDGHEFHEKTKEQAANDKKRDRELAAKGYTVLRFTGSEIWKDPFKCAEEIFNYLQKGSQVEGWARKKTMKLNLEKEKATIAIEPIAIGERDPFDF